VLFVLLLYACPSAVGQETVRGNPFGGHTGFGKAELQEPDRSWWSLWSVPSPYNRAYLGMWTFHPFSEDPFHLETNNGLGIQYRSLFAFTCVNSFDRRTYVAGAERVWLQGRRGHLGAMLGFRIGLIRGYDTELLQVAGETPVLPFAGTVALLRLGPIGGEVSWVYRAVSLVGAVFF
jgi:hypothetical protein